MLSRSNFTEQQYQPSTLPYPPQEQETKQPSSSNQDRSKKICKQALENLEAFNLQTEKKNKSEMVEKTINEPSKKTVENQTDLVLSTNRGMQATHKEKDILKKSQRHPQEIHFLSSESDSSSESDVNKPLSGRHLFFKINPEYLTGDLSALNNNIHAALPHNSQQQATANLQQEQPPEGYRGQRIDLILTPRSPIHSATPNESDSDESMPSSRLGSFRLYSERLVRRPSVFNNNFHAARPYNFQQQIRASFQQQNASEAYRGERNNLLSTQGSLIHRHTDSSID